MSAPDVELLRPLETRWLIRAARSSGELARFAVVVAVFAAVTPWWGTLAFVVLLCPFALRDALMPLRGLNCVGISTDHNSIRLQHRFGPEDEYAITRIERIASFSIDRGGYVRSAPFVVALPEEGPPTICLWSRLWPADIAQQLAERIGVPLVEQGVIRRRELRRRFPRNRRHGDGDRSIPTWKSLW